MTPERWRQIEDLCHQALAHPAGERAAFLAAACVSDSDLQREVQSLLAQESSAGAFMNAPAAAVAPWAVPAHAKGTLAGKRLGSYAIRSLLGVGGMGEVYRAHDDALGREVAIKVLPPAFTADPERRARFDREARMLATLNHPHIGAIYGVEEADPSPGSGQAAVRALVLELVEGETLAERIARTGNPAVRSALPLPDALAIARQIADALDAAHEKGIVHRDLKPANIKITPDGVVKVLDFGLAKMPLPDSPDPGLTQSSAGAILGTAAYMSPEQARGHSVDKRADIWAFGSVLYEMLTGHLAFPGETVSDTIAKIIEREPDWSALPAATPARIRRLLLRCLAKDPKQRLRDIAEARIAIDTIDDVVPGAEVPAARATSAKTHTKWLPWVALAVLAAGVALWEARRPAIIQETPLANARFTRVTDWEGTEGGAGISSDGKFVAFLADRAGEFDLWVSQVGSGRFLNLTLDTPSLGPPGGILRILGFSGDGGEIWFTQAGNSSAPKWLVPLSGGTPRAFLGQGATAPSWSPDDTRLVYFTNGDGDPISIADRTSADARPIVVDKEDFFAKGVHSHNPVWSPDGQWIYFAHGVKLEELNVWRVRPSGGTPEQLTALRAAVNHLAPIDSRTLLYTARAEDGSGPWLWSLDVETKVTRRAISGLEHYSSVSASRDGRRVVTTVTNPTASLWRAPLLDRPAEDRDVQAYALPSARALSPRFGGTSLFYLSAQGAGDSLWRFQDGKPSEVWTAADDSLSEPPAVSPDGSRVAIIVRQEGQRRLLAMSADGTNARTLAASITIDGSGGQGSADWSPDGKWIVAAGSDGQSPGLFIIAVDASAPVRRIVSGQVVNPVWSPNGALIVYGGPVVGGLVPLLGVRPDGTPVELPEVKARLGGGHRFLPNGTGLVYLPRAQSLDFWLLDLTTNKTRALTRLGDHGSLRTFDITPDGKEIVFDRSRQNSDIVLIDLPK